MHEGGLNLAVAPALDGAARDHQAGTSASGRAHIIDARWVALAMLAFAAVWLLHLDYTSLVPPTDDLEQLTWSRSLEWGYYKHPPLPTWLLWVPLKLFGWSAWTVYVAGAATTLCALAIYWRLLAGVRGEAYALIALMAAACITYYNGRLYYYNHNVVLLLASTACAALCWQAFKTRRRRWWAALGLAIGLGALAKYQIAVTVACVAAFVIHQRAWRDAVHRQGMWIAGAVALAVFAPHALWLRSHDLAPIHYAVGSSLGAQFGVARRIGESLHWLADQAFNRALPALLLLAVGAWLAKHHRAQRLSSPPRRDVNIRGDAARALLLSWGVVPLLFMPSVGLALGADLQLHWGTPFLLFAVPALMELTPRMSWRSVDVRLLVGPFLLIQVLLLALSHLTSLRGPQALHDMHWRNFDARSVAEAIGPPARARLGGPIHILSGPAAVAGAIALQWPEKPLVLVDGRLDRSPWVNAAQIAACGLVEMGRTEHLTNGNVIGSSLPGWSWRIAAPQSDPPGACAQSQSHSP